jgi:uncharacterized protein HemY
MKTSKDKDLVTAEEELSSTNRGVINTETIAAAGRPQVQEAEQLQDERSEAELAPLFSDQTERELRTHWQEIQTGFVDEPRHAVEQADQLVARLMQHLAQSFSDQRNNLERQWDQTEKISTEDLRIALRRYRSFFERLLSI